MTLIFMNRTENSPTAFWVSSVIGGQSITPLSVDAAVIV
ncbi:hypothetical protein SAMN05192544_103050 [Paraburkholderia hospita]|nr:hypothetical protein SAMN05192544_103050 [Paraburkholderia hospita]